MSGAASLPVADARAIGAVVRRLLRPRWRMTALGLGLFAAAAVAGMVAPILLGTIVDRVAGGAPPGALAGPVAALAVAAAVQGLLSMAAPAVVAHASEPALAELREEFVTRALDLPLDLLEEAGTGDVVARCDGDVAAVSDAVRAALPELLVAALTVAVSIVGIAALDWRLGVAALCAAPVQVYTLRWYLPRSAPLYAAERDAAGRRAAQLLETVAGADTVRALGTADRHRDLVAERSAGAAALVVDAARLRTRFFARLNVAEAVGLSAVLGVGFLLVRGGDVTVGAVTAAALFVQRAFDPVNVLLGLMDEIQVAAAALGRLVGITALPRPAPPRATSRAAPTVDLAAVTHAYRPGHDVLHDVRLHVRAGERVAVVGASGAGKTTLAKLVAGVHTPSAGTVHVAGRPVADLAEVGGRRPVVLVTQEVHVFAGTLAGDLRLAAPAAGDDDLRRALAAVGAWPWVDALPAGLDTVVGEGGWPLTALQAQHLALARLLLADPAVAILDEATAETGSAGARVLESASAAAVAGRTALVIAHRLTQATGADRVVVLDHGKVVEAGTHADLAAAGGRYADLWRAWSGRGRDAGDDAGDG
ncbi:MAG: ABC transporter ATP-binding protein [Actinomycetota bacterium]